MNSNTKWVRVLVFFHYVFPPVINLASDVTEYFTARISDLDVLVSS